MEVSNTKRGKHEIVDPDNPDQEMIHNCMQKRKRILNPIIDWTTDDVWEFIREYDIPYCKLYDEGFKRLGCIGCPMARAEGRKKEFERWPQYKKLYIHALERMIKRNYEGGGDPQRQNRSRSQSSTGGRDYRYSTASSPEEIFLWWTEQISH